MIYDRLKMIEETQHERPSQDFVEFQSKLLKEIQDQVGIPDEYMQAMQTLAELSEWEACEQYLAQVIRRTISRWIFVIGLLLGVALVTLLTHL